MKKILLAALLAGVASSAFAADLPTRKAAPAPPIAYAPPMFTWTGFYLGLNTGYGFGTTSSATFGDPTGAFVGGTAGYNQQMGQFVLGVEGDWDWAHMTHTQSNPIPMHLRVNQIMTARARAGFAVDRALLFLTAGYAGAGTHGVAYTAPWIANDKWRNGGAIGGGVEYAITNNITAKAEYLYLPFSSKTYFFGTPAQANSKLDMSLLRVGLNYKF